MILYGKLWNFDLIWKNYGTIDKFIGTMDKSIVNYSKLKFTIVSFVRESPLLGKMAFDISNIEPCIQPIPN